MMGPGGSWAMRPRGRRTDGRQGRDGAWNDSADGQKKSMPLSCRLIDPGLSQHYLSSEWLMPWD